MLPTADKERELDPQLGASAATEICPSAKGFTLLELLVVCSASLMA
ncbi:prepilin-type N-terminal cleavage/methylation domain-containing protein [Variovorax soli]